MQLLEGILCLEVLFGKRNNGTFMDFLSPGEPQQAIKHYKTSVFMEKRRL